MKNASTGFLALVGAAVAGFALVVVATLFVGVLAAIPIPAAYWASLKSIPGLALALHSLMTSVLVVALVVLLSAALVRLQGRVSRWQLAVCVLTVLLCAVPDLPAIAAQVWPQRRSPNLSFALSALASFAAMPLAICLGYRIARPVPAACTT